ARRADGDARRAGVPLPTRPRRRRIAVRGDDGHRLLEASGQYLAAHGRHGRTDRGQRMNDHAAAVGPRLSDRQRVHWLRLIRTENVGPATFRDLINRFGSAEAALAMLPQLMASAGARRLPRIPSPAEAEAEIAIAAKNGARLVAIGEAEYP